MQTPYKSLFISHGGGPLPLLGDAGHQEMVHCLKNIAEEITRPEAIVVVSAHWEERLPTITSGIQLPLIYDYYGFPEESYEITYPCPGEPALAQKIQSLLNEADIPCVQISLTDSLDPSLHIRTGQALQRLSTDNVLIIGSGFSFHNLKAFFRRVTRIAKT
jgi:aromatic ring-opening dioxygenase catalytic subunit (LigB family)